jgi:TM2 domain-containing membrane protein YozV
MNAFCRNCGNPLEEGVNFCMKCGTKVVLESAAPAPVVVTDSRREERVRMWLSANANKLPEAQLHIIKEKMMTMSDSDFERISYTSLTDPTLMLIISIFFGMLGVDRFALGDIGLGVGKLLTCGGCYIWWLVDLFHIMDATKQKNMQKINTALYI